MIIKSNLNDYSVTIESSFEFVTELIGLENAYFVIDKNLYDLYEKRLFSNIAHEKLTIVEALEANKTIETVLQICEAMTIIPAKRNARLVSFGGGIIQDITGFAANILYRGIHWTYIPTTLLAACDSCIGGKTSLNYKHYKNLLGTFFPPEDIRICSDFFKSLTERDFQSGLGEVVKFNIMYGERGLSRIEHDLDLLLNRDENTLNTYLETSLAFKKPFIEEDEFDKNVRIHLNYAHTFGHAFETASNYAIPHGTAVAMGMIVANRVSLQRGILDEELVLRSEQALKRIIHVDFTGINLDIDTIIDAIRKDKKQTSSDLTAVLLYDDMKLGIFKDLKPKFGVKIFQY
ncbi:AroB-related putative sugar phosphate phospholyase (cyclizing) [Desulfosporosinus metallidurans]|uniref:3-dehydroquinate synthase n=1 Tax=Desulfosporosinus metallidurans TaxID=1888891 RepID=A0A1Q8QXT9_9FIRM|nr:AroB-related putative sugar phosphate phospholyase (cyclizing) [Desulfosporosinus metallidurans]OLN32148.1 3-dehydroquinate synthase [Desulfosporosinus metallidurans]